MFVLLKVRFRQPGLSANGQPFGWRHVHYVSASNSRMSGNSEKLKIIVSIFTIKCLPDYKFAFFRQNFNQWLLKVRENWSKNSQCCPLHQSPYSLKIFEKRKCYRFRSSSTIDFPNIERSDGFHRGLGWSRSYLVVDWFKRQWFWSSHSEPRIPKKPDSVIFLSLSTFRLFSGTRVRQVR